MTAIMRGKWRVTTQDAVSRAIRHDEFDSLEATLEFACHKRSISYHKVIVEDPDGKMISEAELAQRCVALKVGRARPLS